MQTLPGLERFIDTVEQLPAADPVVKSVEPVADALGRGDVGAFLHGDWLGHALHPLLTDFPLGCWLASGLLDLVGGRRARGASRRLVGTGLLMVPITAASGTADWATVDDARVRRVGVAHAVGNVAVGGAYFLSW